MIIWPDEIESKNWNADSIVIMLKYGKQYDTTPEYTFLLTLIGDVAGEKTNTVSITCLEGTYAETEAITLVTASP